jgi:hypothetical protein
MRRGGRGLRALLVAVVCAAAVGSGTVAHADVSAQGCSAQAVVVVEPGPGAVSICFDGSISGLEALQLAGANPVTYGFSGQGAAVCQLYGVGNPADQSCLIGPGGQYWAYYRAAPDTSGWTYSRGGASSTTVVDGSVEGWRYGTGDSPGFVSFCSVVSCAPPATDPPPPTAPPVTAPAIVSPVGNPTSPTAGNTAPGSGPTTAAPSSTKEGKDTKDAGGSTSGGSTTTTDGGKGTDRGTGSGTRRSQRSTGVALGAGGGSGTDSGSPLGVIVAVAVVALGAGAGLWFRRRHRTPTPG